MGRKCRIVAQMFSTWKLKRKRQLPAAVLFAPRSPPLMADDEVEPGAGGLFK